MFGSRLKSWMENYIGRPRKKEPQKEKSRKNGGGGGVILESSESLAYSDAGISSSSQQVLSSSATDNKEGYSTTTMESEKSGMTHCRTAVSLPSPESAYSTGYSTDGASPGGTGPPEYYINIRTGKHYFPSPAPTPTSPQPNTVFLQHRLSTTTTFSPEDSLPPPNPTRFTQPPAEPSLREAPCLKPRASIFGTYGFHHGFHPHLEGFASEHQPPPRGRTTLSAPVPPSFDILHFTKSPAKKSFPKSQLTPIKLFLKSPKHEKGKPKTPPSTNKKKFSSGGKSKKWFRQPFQKFGHRRTDSFDECAVQNAEVIRELHLGNFRHFLGQENSASPRQRNRIKTNPWLPTEPLSSQNFHNLKIGFSPSLSRNRSCSNTPLQNRKTSQADSLQNRMNQVSQKQEEGKGERAGGRHGGGKPGPESSDHSEEDLTLNEVMGTYNESYVYEKETDILSDSDPTDCEDYATDSEAENGGDEQDSHDDELDFIDNGSVSESDDNFPQNTGKCSYHDVHVKRNSFLYKNDRKSLRRDAEARKVLKKEQDPKGRREKRRQTRKSLKQEGGERRKIFTEITKSPKVEINENVVGLNLGRVLVQRMMAKSAENTPVSARRQQPRGKLRETHIGQEKENAGERRLEVRRDLVLIDFETDSRYNQLIKEAESMIESLKNSPAVTKKNELAAAGQKDGAHLEPPRSLKSADPSRALPPASCPRGDEFKAPETPSRKSPRNLGLKLSAENPKKPKRLDLEGGERSSFKKRTSAHSPLDPLGPSLRNFAVFRPLDSGEGKPSTSSSEDSDPDKVSLRKGRKGRWAAAPEPPIVPIAFQSVDLGKALASYCPQSEPVKRKIYSCSKTYDKLVKRFENSPITFEDTQILPRPPPTACSGIDTCLDGNQGLPPKERTRARKGAPPQSALRPTSFDPVNPQRRSFDSDAFS